MTFDFKAAKVLGQLSNASNATLLIEQDDQKYIYKPQVGERQLYDFPTGTLFKRERAAYVLAQLLGWDLVPQTVIVNGPYGIGSAQHWLEATVSQVDVFVPSEVPKDWLKVTSGVDESGKQVVLAHADTYELKRLTLFDAIANNADRKAGHILSTSTQLVWGIDHGVTFNADPKLRTVLWGFIDQQIPTQLIADINNLQGKLEQSELGELLDPDEIAAIRSRIDQLLETQIFPAPSANWPAVPWPVF